MRKKFEELGLWKDKLVAKLDMLWECIKNNLLAPILKTINMILGSVKGVFGPFGVLADVMEEFKNMMEIMVDGLEEDQPITLDIPDPSPLKRV